MIYMVSLINDAQQLTVSLYGITARDEQHAIEIALALLNPVSRDEWTSADVYEVEITEPGQIIGTLQ